MRRIVYGVLSRTDVRFLDGLIGAIEASLL